MHMLLVLFRLWSHNSPVAGRR